MELDPETPLGTNPQDKRMLAPTLSGTLQVEEDRAQEIRKVGRSIAINFRQHLTLFLWHKFLKPALMKPYT